MMVELGSDYLLGRAGHIRDNIEILWNVGRSKRREASPSELGAVAEVVLTLRHHQVSAVHADLLTPRLPQILLLTSANQNILSLDSVLAAG
jgi:hypothetical protein